MLQKIGHFAFLLFIILLIIWSAILDAQNTVFCRRALLKFPLSGGNAYLKCPPKFFYDEAKKQCCRYKIRYRDQGRTNGKCVDLAVPGRPSDCPVNKERCDDPIWRDLMTKQCPKTCNRCQRDDLATCRDGIGPNGVSECPQNKARCNDPNFREFMRKECPKTCGVCGITRTSNRRRFNFSEILLWGCTSLTCSLNMALDPCDDFYKFVCSGFIKNTGKLPPEFSVKSQFNILWHRSYMELIALLNNQNLRQNAQRNNDKFSQQMFTFYDSCLDKQNREASKSDGLFAHLRAAKFNPNKKLHLFNTEWCINAFPFVPFFNVESTWDVRPGTKAKSMFLFEPQRPLTNYGDLLNEESRQKFALKLSKILHYLLEDDLANEGQNGLTFFRGGLSAGQYEVEIQRRVESFIQMEMRIGRAFEFYEDDDLERFTDFTRPEQYLSIGELINKFSPQIDWLTILQHFPQSFSNGLNYQSEMLILGHNLLIEYAKIIEKTQREEPQMLSDYLDWHLIWWLLFELDGRFGELLDPWKKNEWNCVRNFVRIYFKHWLDRLYVENIFDKSKIDRNKRILSYSKRAFSSLLDEAKWMDTATRAKAKQKLAQLKDNIGYFRLIEDDQFLEKLYANFDIKEGMPWAQMFGQVHRQFYLWPTLDYQASFWVDGFYKWVYNSLAIYGGIIHSPWFDPKWPSVMNFGAMGTFIGHEITHGYDSAGRYFDGQGNKLKPEDLNEGTMKRMEEAMECFVQQYGQYEGEKPRPYEYFTLAENIADNGAIRASHRAWMAFKEENSVELEQKSPIGMGQFNDEQLFFISSAFMYCTAFQEQEDVDNYALDDNHGFPQARVNLPLRNFDAFSKAFNCPIGSKMNPKNEEKCQLW